MATIPKKTVGKIKIMKKHIFLSCLFVFFFSSCAMPGKSSYVNSPPPEITIDNEMFIDRPFSEVWDELFKELAKSFYVINNIEKTSRIINISFSTDTPEEYVDFGTTTRTYDSGTEHEEYTYKLAESSSYKLAYKPKMRIYGQYGLHGISNINRKTSLDGRANIYIAPENNGTRITVNCRFVLNVNTAGSNYIIKNMYGVTVASGLNQSEDYSVAFNTNQEKRSNWGTAKEPVYITCHSTGKLEQDILSLIKQ